MLSEMFLLLLQAQLLQLLIHVGLFASFTFATSNILTKIAGNTLVSKVTVLRGSARARDVVDQFKFIV